MPGIPENYIKIEYQGKVIFVASVLSTDSTSLEIEKRQAVNNLATLVRDYEVAIQRLEKRLDNVENELKTIKGEE